LQNPPEIEDLCELEFIKLQHPPIIDEFDELITLEIIVPEIEDALDLTTELRYDPEIDEYRLFESTKLHLLPIITECGEQ